MLWHATTITEHTHTVLSRVSGPLLCETPSKVLLQLAASESGAFVGFSLTPNERVPGLL